MSARALFGIILFMGLITLLANTLISTQNSGAFISNITSNGTVIISTGNTNFNTGFGSNICNIPANNNAIIQIFNSIPILNCATGFINFLLAFQGISSSIGWLQLILYACIAVLVYMAAKLVPFIGG